MLNEDPLAPGDIKRLAELQVSLLPGSLVSRLGQRYAEAFYRFAALSKQEFVLVERDDGGKVIAGAVVTLNVSTLEQRLLVQTPLVFAAIPRVFRLRDRIGSPVERVSVEGPELLQMFTDPAHRGTGAASRLLRRVEEHLRERGASHYFVRTSDDPSSRALKYFKLMGFDTVRNLVFRGERFQLLRKFSDRAIEALLELRWLDLTSDQVQSLRPLLRSNDIETLIVACRRIKRLPSSPAVVPGEAADRDRRNDRFDSTEQILSLIRTEIGALSREDLDKSFNQLGVDSFAMLTLRTKLEQTFATTIDDESWTAIVTPADIVRVLVPMQCHAKPEWSAPPASERRAYTLNMPQMALGGMSEFWLFKELGDIHWSMITTNLRRASRQLKDTTGARLYATFTRLQLESTTALAAYEENEAITIEARAVRYGAGMFFSDASLQGEGRSAQVRIMSSFSKYGEAGANTSLLKGQPQIPADCAIRDLGELPPFGRAYRAQRAVELPEAIFECCYDIIPFHDINGVGLLYFAAYPIINDICAMRYAGAALTKFSTRNRDVFYFANCDAEEKLIYRLHHWRAHEDRIEMEASISRKSDGVLMAYAVTTKQAIANPAPLMPS
jgi:probable biosynthetic protein (TIGR04098 family)